MAEITREEALEQFKLGRIVRLGGYQLGNAAELDKVLVSLGRGDEVPEAGAEASPSTIVASPEGAVPSTGVAAVTAPAIVGDGLEARGVTVEHLRKTAKDEGLDLGDDLKTKPQIIEAIRAHRAGNARSTDLADLAARPIEDLRSIAEMDGVEHAEDASAEDIAAAIVAKRAGAGATA